MATTGIQLVPAVANLPAWTQVRAGGDSTCGIDTNGSLTCRGRASNRMARVTDFIVGSRQVCGLTGSRRGPRVRCAGQGGGIAPMSRIEDVVSFDVGTHHFCALDQSATVRCWGRNDDGQVGDGSVVRRRRPVELRFEE
jgi:hypothetical protein